MPQPSAHSPLQDGFAALWHEPVLFAAELVWRWCFGLAAWSLAIISAVWFLDSLKISPGDELLLGTLQPAVAQRGRAPHFPRQPQPLPLGAGVADSRPDAALGLRGDGGARSDTSPTGRHVQRRRRTTRHELGIQAHLCAQSTAGDVVADRADRGRRLAAGRHRHGRQPASRESCIFPCLWYRFGVGVRSPAQLVLRDRAALLHSQRHGRRRSAGAIGGFLFPPGWPFVRDWELDS